jgi:hypothetical protein
MIFFKKFVSILTMGTLARQSKHGSYPILAFLANSRKRDVFQSGAMGQCESKRARTAPNNAGRCGLYKTISSSWEVAFVAAARSLGGQLLVSFY